MRTEDGEVFVRIIQGLIFYWAIYWLNGVVELLGLSPAY